MSTRVLVVDDTVVFRRIVSEALAAVPGVEVLGSAANGRLALARIAALRPDLITLDMEMPEMNGIQLLEALRAQGLETGVVLLSSLTRRGGELTVKALELGAFDFITKPERGTPEENIALVRSCLLPIIRTFQRQSEIRGILRGKAPKAAPAPAPPPRPAGTVPAAAGARLAGSARMVLIGVSTGGPRALATLLPALPRDLGVPLFVVQHMPPLFTGPLADSLASKCGIRVKEAVEGEIAAPSCAYIAPGGRQMKLARGGQGEIVLRITGDPPENNCRPSVDYLFRSAALQFPGAAVAVILTGMGADGTHGLRLLKRGGCFAIAQDEATSVVFGMPKEAIQTGLVDLVAPLDQLGGALLRAVREAAP